ncbi:hypothetical protein HETIRDRAFT_118682 [Heterobasidion irregulare TC 32-1]|uniref:Uncharacterized protein n=1 Tax=Heterobasidion irregulare (strain TC 32-1) TaxID=747525 RepID=W4JT99_HETIT|nr:uncharacterized protein HETIRDRAFT_118682 [Heterobasidion irregulare TC 32-1]ETW76315.1 hypothetical protein HETIRDRAFT_118682 [Heterobasidion irregulare TC 32-1]
MSTSGPSSDTTVSSLELVSLGQKIVTNSFGLLFEIWFHGMRQGSNSKANVTMLIVTLTMFSMSTAVLGLNFATVVQEVRHWFILNPSLSLVERERVASNYSARFDWVQDTLFSVEFSIGDSIVLWRAWTLSQASGNTIYIVYVGILLILASFNRQHRRLIKASFGDTARRTRVEKVLVLLVESGVIYFALWVAQIFDFLPITSSSAAAGTASTILSSAGNQLVGLYPTIIVVLVHYQRSLWDSPEVTLNHIKTSISFVSPPSTAVVQSRLTVGEDANHHFDKVVTVHPLESSSTSHASNRTNLEAKSVV